SVSDTALHRTAPNPKRLVSTKSSRPPGNTDPTSAGCLRVGLVSNQRNKSSEIRSTPIRPARPSRSRYRHSPLPRLRNNRKSTRLNSSHVSISYAVFCLKKKMGRVDQEDTVLIISHVWD